MVHPQTNRSDDTVMLGEGLYIDAQTNCTCDGTVILDLRRAGKGGATAQTNYAVDDTVNVWRWMSSARQTARTLISWSWT